MNTLAFLLFYYVNLTKKSKITWNLVNILNLKASWPNVYLNAVAILDKNHYTRKLSFKDT